MTELVDAGIDKAKILAEIGVVPIPAPSAAPPRPRAEASAAAPPREAAGEGRGALGAPGAALSPKRILPPRPQRLLVHRVEASAIVLGFVALLWLSVGLATGQGTPVVLGSAFLGLGLGAALVRGLGKKP